MSTRAKPIQIASAGKRSCALFETGEIACWGESFVRIKKVTPLIPLMELPNGLRAKSIMLAPSHSCLISTDDQIYCWGYNPFGQLGFPANNNEITLLPSKPALIGTNMGALQVSGSQYATCALLAPRDNDQLIKESAVVKCWGRNISGALGTGKGDSVLTAADFETLNPIELPPGVVPVSVKTSESQTCIVSKYGLSFCWGENSSSIVSQIPDNVIGDSSPEMGEGLEPLNLGSLERVKDIETGPNILCAVLKNGQVKCWGFLLNTSAPPGFTNLYSERTSNRPPLDFSELLQATQAPK
jgi:alpha-tubulin suppressor-like RCC1 family protein